MMSSSPLSCTAAAPIAASEEDAPPEMEVEVDERFSSLVDPFLLDALQNPRHRLMVLRMELDIQKFMENRRLHEFVFQHFPTSYLRCAAHRVAQHYGLETMVADSTVDGSINRIFARKTPESRYPSIYLSEVPSKQAKNDSDRAESFKIVICQRPEVSQNGSVNAEKRSTMKTVEERKEEYDKARARIFSGPTDTDIESSQTTASDGTSLFPGRGEPVKSESAVDENKNFIKNCRSRVAVFRDTEKDRSDPDYDRNYKRYVRGPVPDFGFSPGAVNFGLTPFVQYDASFLQSTGFPRSQTSVHFSPSEFAMRPSCGTGYQQPTGNTVYFPWLSPAIMYPHCYHNLSHMVSQGPLYQSSYHLRNG